LWLYEFVLIDKKFRFDKINFEGDLIPLDDRDEAAL
jgi:hypothetical protein